MAAWRRLLLLAVFGLYAAFVRAEAPPLLLAENYRPGIPVADYLISEKLDGVRAYWDGAQLRFRSGRPIAAPDWFVAVLPRGQQLDGELWLGRGRFDELSRIVRRDVPRDDEWRSVRYFLFELPAGAGDFSARVAALQAIVGQVGKPWLQVVEQFRLPDEVALRQRLQAVIRAGGEGLMLHRADAPYLSGRQAVLLKLKAFDDAEAVVVAHLPGKGKFSGQTGALRVLTPEGREFSLAAGLRVAERQNPPSLGSTVTYRYRGLTASGLPRFASFLRVRESE